MTNEGITDPRIAIYQTGAAGAVFEHALVLEALGFDYELRSDGPTLEIAVAAAEAERARRELAQYRTENAAVAPAPPPAPPAPGAALGVMGYVLALLAITWLDDRAAFTRDWFALGRLDAGLVGDGEWWRTITALTLHADGGHLFGNLVFGTLFGYAAGQLLGGGAAWLGILLSAALGNAVNAFVQAPTHTSIGASTAVFAALGVSSAYAWWRQRRTALRWAQRWGALIAGAVLLAFLGVGDEHTDIVAHLTGFACGALVGGAWSILGPRPPGGTTQAALGTAAAGLLAGAWYAALRS